MSELDDLNNFTSDKSDFSKWKNLKVTDDIKKQLIDKFNADLKAGSTFADILNIVVSIAEAVIK